MKVCSRSGSVGYRRSISGLKLRTSQSIVKGPRPSIDPKPRAVKE